MWASNWLVSSVIACCRLILYYCVWLVDIVCNLFRLRIKMDIFLGAHLLHKIHLVSLTYFGRVCTSLNPPHHSLCVSRNISLCDRVYYPCIRWRLSTPCFRSLVRWALPPRERDDNYQSVFKLVCYLCILFMLSKFSKLQVKYVTLLHPNIHAIVQGTLYLHYPPSLLRLSTHST